MAKKYKLVEIFHSLQGEGQRLGTANVFVRFSHCNLSCQFCDTDYDEVNDELTAAEIVAQIATFACPNVIFTGGEPTLALDADLLTRCKLEGWYLAIESNGLQPVPAAIDWITISPKTSISSLRQRHGDELKIVYGTQKDLPAWRQLDFTHFFLSPINERNQLNPENNRQTLNYVLANPQWRFTTQLHKVLGVR
jgi:7-carboxy-7-deazaguanine synthase